MAKSDILVGGVSSNFRINPFTGQKMYLEKASGSRIYTTDGKEYLDFFMGHGAVLLGHDRPEIHEAVKKVFERGFYAEFDSEDNLRLAEQINRHIPCAEAVRFTNSGTEATLILFRIVRAFTKRNLVIRIDGHFHGATDYVIPNNLARAIDLQNPGGRASRMNETPGIPPEIASTIRIIPWNDVPALRKIISTEGDKVAALIMNPVDFNNGCITTTAEYLKEVKEILHKNGSLLIFDEVLAGFKMGISCAQGYYGVTPDLCSLSKAFSNGVPISAVAGRKDVMNVTLSILAGGTFTGNQIGVNAALASLKIMSSAGFYDRLLGNAGYFFNEVNGLFKAKGFNAILQSLGCGFGIYFGTTERVTDYRQFEKLDWEMSRTFFTKVIQKGVYFHTDFTVSAAHSREDLSRTLEIFSDVIDEMKSKR